MIKLRKIIAILSCMVSLLCGILLIPQITNDIELQAYTSSSKSSWEWFCEYYYNTDMNITYDEYIMLCSVVQGETGGAELQWAELVAGVIKNRVESEDFPNTISGVLAQPNQFTAIKNYYNGIDINDTTYQAVGRVFGNQAYDTMYNLNGALYYCNPDILSYDIMKWFYTLEQTYDAYYYSGYYTFHHTFYK